MKKTLVFAIFALLLVLPVSTAGTVSTAETYCAGADLIQPVDMWVVGDGCHWSNQFNDTETVNIPGTATYTVTGVVHRGNPGQCQTHEVFTTTINGQTGPVVQDDADPCAETTTEEYLGTFNLVAGDTVVYMDTAAKCPPDTQANSVDLSQLCFYEDGNKEVPEFGVIGALVAVAGVAGFAVFRRKY